MLMMLTSCSLIYAANGEIASDVIKIKAIRINNILTQHGNTEAFMDLENTGMKSHSLIAAYSPMTKQIQIHETLDHDKKSSMNKVNAIVIPAHEDKDLHYGGMHLMLIGLNQSLQNLESIPITLIFDDGSWITADAEVFTAPATT